MLGDMIGIFGSASAAIYYIYFEKLVVKLPSLLSITLIMTSSALSITIFGSIFVPDFTLGLNPTTGVFGFLTYGDLFYAFVLLGLLGGALTFGPLGYVLKSFSPLVLCTA